MRPPKVRHVDRFDQYLQLHRLGAIGTPLEAGRRRTESQYRAGLALVPRPFTLSYASPLRRLPVRRACASPRIGLSSVSGRNIQVSLRRGAWLMAACRNLAEDAESLPQKVRSGLRRLAKAVVVITCTHNHQSYAMAATAVSEVSMDPPAMLICVNRAASLHEALAAGADFCINILHANDEPIARRCHGATKGEARFALADWIRSADAPPRLANAQASFLCRQRETLGFGTHSIIIGEVVDCHVSGEADPLIYAEGRYASLPRPLAAQQ